LSSRNEIEKLVQDGHETRAATSLLVAMEHGLDALEHHRKIVVEMIESLEAVIKPSRAVSDPSAQRVSFATILGNLQ
jgi:hypothetical protein